MVAVPGARVAGVARVRMTCEGKPSISWQEEPLKRHDSGLPGDVELCSRLEWRKYPLSEA